MCNYIFGTEIGIRCHLRYVVHVIVRIKNFFLCITRLQWNKVNAGIF